MRVLVTGGNGFIGRALLEALRNAGRFEVRGSVRSGGRDPVPAGGIVVGELGGDTDWSEALSGVDVVVHLAGRAHILREKGGDTESEFHRVNVEGTTNLARQAAAQGVSRFIFVSSIKVHGEEGFYSEDDTPAPADAYGASKYKAEQVLWKVGGKNGMELVIVRSPLVYGPGAKANFRLLLRAVRAGVPLPFGRVRNRRSLVGIANLVDFLLTCIEHPAAANQVFLVSDGEDLSTSELVRRIARAMGKKSRLIGIPVPILRVGGALIGRPESVRSMVGTLCVDASKASRLLGWRAPFSVDEALRYAVAGF